ncbi:MAG: DUF4189 domain-containing protein [Saezia sp.]
MNTSMMKKQLFAAMLLFLLSITSHAQCLPTDTSCTPISTEQRAPDQGFDPSLMLPPQLISESQNEPEIVRSSDWMEQKSHLFIPKGTPSWGAVAKDPYLPGLKGLGVSDNWVSEQDAAWSALDLCKKNGGQDCFVEQTYFNACLAVAVSDKGGAYWSTGVTRELAMQEVMQVCASKNQGSCQLPYAQCSYSPL